MAKVTVIGAGSVVFSMRLIQDLCLTESLGGSTITFMDIDERRLDMVYELASRYVKETGARLTLEKTTDRKRALDGSDFVINTVKVGGYRGMESEREIAERHGYYRGIDDRVSDYYGGIAAYHQLAFFLELARDVERICPDAWYLQVSNPVFEGTTLVLRETKLKTVGFCHGFNEYREMVKVLGLDPDDVQVQVAGFNHYIFLTRFLYRGEDAYPRLDEWIEKKASEYWNSDEYLREPWNTQMSRAAVEIYRLYGLFPIGDTVRTASPWWMHTDLKTKAQWFPAGGPDSEVGWTLYLNRLHSRLNEMQRIASDPSISPTTEFPPVPSGEFIVPFIDSVVNGTERRLVINVANDGTIPGIPDDVAIEVPVVVKKGAIEKERIDPLPERLMLHVLIPRWLRMERILHAFKERDKTSLILTLTDDPRTTSFDQAARLIDELLGMPWNSEARQHYV
ncbi:MAG TPA: alpha-glucosidase/alpha-galactosidase [Limnochordales bacterium]